MSNPTPQPDPKALASELQRYREIAEKATAGPWRAGPKHVETHDPEILVACTVSPGARAGTKPAAKWRADAEHIATFDPPTVIRLVDITLSQAKEIEGLKELARRVDLLWRALSHPASGDLQNYEALQDIATLARAALSSSPDLVGGDQESSVAGVQAAPGGATEGPTSAGLALPLLASDHIYHTEDCATWDGDGSGDERCSCGAVEVLVQLETAYALLWSVQTSDTKVHAARKQLLRLIGKDGQRRAIAALPDWARPTGPTPEMRAPDPAKSSIRQPSEASTAALATDDPNSFPSGPETRG